MPILQKRDSKVADTEIERNFRLIRNLLYPVREGSSMSAESFEDVVVDTKQYVSIAMAQYLNEMSNATAIEYLDNLYKLDNPNEIKAFISQNSFLIKIIYDAKVQIDKYFGQVTTHLQLHKDPEEGWDELFIIIKSPNNVEKTVELEEKLADDWFLDIMDATKGKLNITAIPI